MPTNDGYPTRQEIKRLRLLNMKKHDFTSWTPDDDMELIEFIKSIWWAPDWGFRLYKGWRASPPKRCQAWKLGLHTGGWSGNEEIIYLLKHTYFWLLYWTRSERGGHYWFEIPIISKKRKESKAGVSNRKESENDIENRMA